MVKRENLHIRLTPRFKSILKHYVSLLRLQGKKITEGEIIEEALEQYEIENKCKRELEKSQRLFMR